MADDAIDFIIEKNFNADFGARPLKRAVERNLEDPLSEAMLSGKLEGPHKVIGFLDDEEIKFRFEKIEADAEPEEEKEKAGAKSESED